MLDSVSRCLQKNDYEKAGFLCRSISLSQIEIVDFRELFEKHKPDNVVCETCGRKSIKHLLDVNYRWIKVEECNECDSDIENQRIEKIIREVPSFILPKRYLWADIKDFPHCYQAICDKTNDGFFLHGSRGVGKTHLMAAIVNELLSKITRENYARMDCDDFALGLQSSMLPAFISVPELLMEIRACYDNKILSEKDVLAKYSDAETLMLDDLGAEKSSEWVLQTLYLLIDRRYRNMKRTIISSNYTISQLSKRVGDRIGSRIAEMCQIVEVKGKDRRIQKNKS